MYEKIHEINNKIKEKIISAISFQDTVVWSDSYVPNGQNLTPIPPNTGEHIIRRLKFSVLGEERLRNEILVKILELNKETEDNTKDDKATDNIRLEFKVRHSEELCASGKDIGKTYYYIGEIDVSIKENDDE